ncbi:MAG: hypothetical protein V1664_00745 [Candidatus Uhrbacteria bacterium]
MRGILFRILAQALVPSQKQKKIFLVLFFVGLIFLSTTQIVFAVSGIDTSATQHEQTPGWIDTFLDILSGLLVSMALMVGQIVVFMIGVLTIPLLQYNNFVNSPVVGMGWAIVRDAVNMFYVIILILIAFGTVLGMDRFKWREQIPRLLGTAIVINFSRTLCGIMIDFSQVMTLTFVNAVKDIAGGNFIQLFGITSILEANGNAERIFGANGTGPTSFDMFSASVVALMMMLIVLVTMLFLTIIFAYRIVLLWALITVAPLAWFMKGSEGVLKNTQAYTDWWNNFKCALQVGPILTFFLWLALAVAGSGNIATEAGFTTSNAPAGEGLDSNSLLASMTMDKMIGFVVGIALIFVGFDAASKSCSAASDKRISGMLGTAKKWATPIATAPVAGAALAAKYGYGWKGAKATGKGVYNQTLGRGVAKTRNWAGGVMGRIGAHGLTPTFARGFFTTQSAKIKAKEAAEAEATVKEKPMDKDSLIAYLKGGPSAFDVNNRQYSARLKEALGRDDVMDELKPEELKKILEKPSSGGKTAQGRMEETFAADPATKKQMDALKKKMPTVFGSLEDVKDEDDVKGLAKSQFANKDVRKHIEGMEYWVSETDKDGKQTRRDITMKEAIEKNYLGTGVKDRWKKGQEEIDKADAEGSKTKAESEKTPSVMQKAESDLSSVTPTDIAGAGSLAPGSALATKFLTEGRGTAHKDQLEAVGDKLGLSGMSAADKETKILAPLLQGKNAKERAQIRINLAVASGSGDPTKPNPNAATQAFSLQPSAPGSKTMTMASDDKKDLAAAAVSSPETVIQLMNELKAKGESSADVDAVIQEKGIEMARALVKKYKGSSDPKVKADAKKALEDLKIKIFGETKPDGTPNTPADIKRTVELIDQMGLPFMLNKEDKTKLQVGREAERMERADEPGWAAQKREKVKNSVVGKAAGGFASAVSDVASSAARGTETFVAKAFPGESSEEIAARAKQESIKEEIKQLQAALSSRTIGTQINGTTYATLPEMEERIKEIKKKIKEERQEEAVRRRRQREESTLL